MENFDKWNMRVLFMSAFVILSGYYIVIPMIDRVDAINQRKVESLCNTNPDMRLCDKDSL